jgi:hypothetical protein
MKRLTWLLLVGVLLKLSMGSAMALPLMGMMDVMGHAKIAALAPCHEGNTAGHFTGHTAENRASAPAHPKAHQASHDSAHPASGHAEDHASDGKDPTHAACADCQMCCAVGLLAVHPSLPPSAPAAAPQGVSPLWISQNLRPELRPPLL